MIRKLANSATKHKANEQYRSFRKAARAQSRRSRRGRVLVIRLRGEYLGTIAAPDESATEAVAADQFRTNEL